MDRYRYEWVKGKYLIRRGCDLVVTPGGNPFSTIYEDLAAMICEDMDRYGADPLDSLSYVTLHASYMDFGFIVAKSELVRSLLVRYRPEWDVALRQLNLLRSVASWPFTAWGPASSGMTLDLKLYLGAPEQIQAIQAWLENLSVRAICSAQVCSTAFHSIHVGYRLLHPRSPISVSTLAQGITTVSDMIHPFFADEDDPENTRENIMTFLEKVKSYASFPDEKLS
ncbi:MAG: hypothetical protein A4E65_01175 [Syntrophorhabdus sp. PtaU1.Bin153]|nr:MAG: hypothetical protein A4E65_01175 [Syntrophorhabdus sp. PtaU1.Bin153]